MFTLVIFSHISGGTADLRLLTRHIADSLLGGWKAAIYLSPSDAMPMFGRTLSEVFCRTMFTMV